MTFYADMAATAADLITAFGQPVTLTRSTPGSYDAATGTVTNSTTTQSGLGVEEAYSARSIDGALILSGDKKLMLSVETAAGAAITAPQVEDTVTFPDTSVWTIKAVEPLSPGGTALIYTLQLRRT